MILLLTLNGHGTIMLVTYLSKVCYFILISPAEAYIMP